VRDNGGISDHDETRGDEREAAFAHPPKGKKRLTSEHVVKVVQTTSKATEPTLTRPRYDELPDWVDAHWFRYTFVTTYMAFVGQTVNPWDVPVKTSVLAMQKIWDATSSRKYKITASSAVHDPMPCGLMVQCYRVRRRDNSPGVL